ISSSKISRCSMVRWRACWAVMGMVFGGYFPGFAPWRAGGWQPLRRALAPAASEGSASGVEEILQQRVAVLAEDRLRVELHALHGVLAVAQAHDRLAAAVVAIGPGRDLEAVRQAGLLHHQGMVARGLEGIRQPGE